MSTSKPPKVLVDATELASGLLMIVFAAAFAWFVLRRGGLPLGTARAMGPGYFPLMVSILLAGLGVIIMASAVGRATAPVQWVSPRSMFLVLLAPVVFGAIVSPIGFVAGVALIVLISAWASHQMTLRWAIAIMVGMTVFCVVVFYYLLRMPVWPWGDGSLSIFG